MHILRSDLKAVALLLVLFVLAPALALAQTSLPEVVTGTADHAVHVYDSSGRLAQTILAHDTAVNAVAVSADGHNIVSCAADATVRMWSATDGMPELSFDAHDRGVLCLALSPDGRALATGGGDSLIKLWNPLTGKLIRSLPAHSQPVRALAWSPDSRFFASGGVDRLIRIWRADGTLAGTIITQDDPITSLAFAPDGTYLVSGAGDGYIKVWNTTDFGIVARQHAHDRGVSSVAFSREGVLATAGGDGQVKLWTIGIRAVSESHAASTGKAINCIGWSQDGRLLVTGGSDKTVRYLSGKDLGEVFRVKESGAVTCVAVGPG